jgi:beta-glucosidase
MLTERIIYPPNFIWGAAASSYQIEGAWNEDGKGESIWDRFSHTAGKIKNGDTGDIACDHYHRYKEDVTLMKELGLRAYRFSISWPRVLPQGRGNINKPGLDFYHHLIDELLGAGIEPWVCLYHWDLPQSLQDEGGWANRDIVYHFAHYAKFIAHEFSDKVKRWVILNEPGIVAAVGHLVGIHAPGIKDVNTFLKVSHHQLLAQGKAVQALRNINPNFEIGTALNLSPVHPISSAKEDQEAASRLDECWNRWYLDPLFKGEYPPFAEKMINPTKEDLEVIYQPLDFLGINYYQRSLVSYDPTEPLIAARLVPKNSFLTEMGWEIYPDGLYQIMMRLKEEYNNPVVYITENGAAFDDKVTRNGEIQDDDRIVFLRDHMVAAYRAMKEGARFKGYLVWSIMDNFEWAEGYAKRFGLVHIDYQTLKRTLKKSARWYKQLITNNGFTLF